MTSTDQLTAEPLPSKSVRAVIISSHSGLPLFSLHSPYTEKIDTVLFSGLMTAIQDHLNEYSEGPSSDDDISMITKGEFIFVTLNEKTFYVTIIMDIDNPISEFKPFYMLARIFKDEYEPLLLVDDPRIYQTDTFKEFKYVALLLISYPNLDESSKPSRIPMPLIPRIAISKEELEFLNMFDGELSFQEISKITGKDFHEIFFVFSKLWYAGLAVANYDPYVYDLYVVTQKGIDALLYGSLSQEERPFLPLFNGNTTLIQIQKNLKLSKKKIERLVTDLVNKEYIRPLSLHYSFLESINYLISQLLTVIYEKYSTEQFIEKLRVLTNDDLSLILKTTKDEKWVELSSSFRTLVEELYDAPVNVLKYLTPLFLLMFSFITQKSSIKQATSTFRRSLNESKRFYPNSFSTYDIISYFRKNQFI